MIEQKHIIELFTRLGHAAVAIISQATSQPFRLSDPTVRLMTKAELADRGGDPACLACTPVEAPRAGALLFVFKAPMDTLMPELFINPEATAPPPRFTDLHKGAVAELLSIFWSEAASLLGEKIGANFKVRNTVVSHQTLAEFAASMPLFTGLDSFLVAEHTMHLGSGAQGGMMQVYPAVFFKELMMPPATIPAPASDYVDSQARTMQAIPIQRVAPDDVKKRSAHRIDAPEAASMLAASRGKVSKYNLPTLLDIPVNVVVELGQARMSVSDILALAPGSIVRMESSVSEPVSMLMNGTVVARGDVVTKGEYFALQISEIATPQLRLETL